MSSSLSAGAAPGAELKLNHVTLAVTGLDRSVTFYERLGLETVVYAPPRYARLASPGGESTLSVEVMPGGPPTGPAAAHLYLECDRLDEVCAGLAAAGLAFEQPPTDMPYLWREAHLRDPDGHQVRLYRAGSNRLNPPWRLSRAEQEQLVERLLEAPPLASRSVRIEPWTGSRRDLLPLFELADDSVVQIERYIDEGHVITAIADGPVGHLQLVHGGGTGHLEIRSLAVAELWQRKGIGRRLVAAAIEECRARGVARLTVSTAASSLSALRFYLAQGFRVSRVLRDAFGEAQGYPPGLRVEGLPLNDALLLDLEIGVARASMGDA